MSMLLPYDTMSMKNPLSVALKIFNVEAQLQAIAQPIMILKKNRTFALLNMYNNMEEMDCISCKCLLYFLPL
jgi:hypothetical protein